MIKLAGGLWKRLSSRINRTAPPSHNAAAVIEAQGKGALMCKRQIRTRLAPPKPCNDNERGAIWPSMSRLPIAYRMGILAAALERTECIRLDVLAAGVVTIQGQYPRSKKEKRPSSHRAL